VAWQGEAGEGVRQCDLVVGADGVRSAVRGALFPGFAVRYSGSTSWRAVVPDSNFDQGLTEVWGPGTEFGVLRVGADEIYWFGEFLCEEGASFSDELEEARRLFDDWPPWVRAIVGATDPSQLVRHDVFDLGEGCPSYAVGRVVLVGDAAHAMLPTIGQGAATALEDAVCVGAMIGVPTTTGGDLARALSAFDRARRPRCRWLARQATRIARYGFELGPGWRQDVRRSVLRILPVGLAMAAGSRVTRWVPPTDRLNEPLR
jgi:2-polyprenyl-6-methoxyphenol hydroxylase-like FAD-dependent oxidoreductase